MDCHQHQLLCQVKVRYRLLQNLKNRFYYFVADGSGGHKFTRNLNEHNKAVQEYLRWYRSQKNAK